MEIFEPTLPLYSIRKRIKNYFDFYFSNNWEENIGKDFPTLVFVFPTMAALVKIKRFTAMMLAEYEDIDLKIQFMTEAEVRTNETERAIEN